MTDSYLIKRIKKLERKAKNASDFDKRHLTSLGMAYSTINGILETIHEAEFDISRKEDEEEADRNEDK